MVDTSPEYIEEMMTTTPAITVGEVELDAVKYPIFLSQPIPNKFAWDDRAQVVEMYNIFLNDIGHGER